MSPRGEGEVALVMSVFRTWVSPASVLLMVLLFVLVVACLVGVLFTPTDPP